MTIGSIQLKIELQSNDPVDEPVEPVPGQAGGKTEVWLVDGATRAVVTESVASPLSLSMS